MLTFYWFYVALIFMFIRSHALPTYGGMDASCLIKCLGKEQQVNNTLATLSNSDFCDQILFPAYYLCSSFEIATARCQRHSQCRKECSVEEWCHFGTAVIANCQGDEWHNFTDASLLFYGDCLDAEASYIDENPQDTSTTISTGAKLQTIALIIVVAFLGGTVSLMLLHLFKFCPEGTSRDSYRGGSDNDYTRGLFSRVPIDSCSSDSLNFEDSDMSNASSMISFGQGNKKQSKASFYREKFQIWTGARRKKDVNNEYELSLSQSVQASNNVNNDIVNRALTDAISSSSSD